MGSQTAGGELASVLHEERKHSFRPTNAGNGVNRLSPEVLTGMQMPVMKSFGIVRRIEIRVKRMKRYENLHEMHEIVLAKRAAKKWISKVKKSRANFAKNSL